MITNILRSCAGIVLTLGIASPQDVAFFREYGPGPEQPSELATDGTAYYLVGGELPSYSAIPGIATPGFLRKLDALGNEVWVRRFSPSTLLLRPYGVAVYSGAVYAAGYSGGDFSTRTGARAFLRKYDASGNELWTREFGSDRDTAAYGPPGKWRRHLGPTALDASDYFRTRICERYRRRWRPRVRCRRVSARQQCPSLV